MGGYAMDSSPVIRLTVLVLLFSVNSSRLASYQVWIPIAIGLSVLSCLQYWQHVYGLTAQFHH